MLKQVLKQSLLVALPVLTLTSTAHAVSDAELMKQGIWRDPKTGLYWDRCSVGQSWNGTTCTGEPIKLNWQDAKDYVAKFTNQQAKGGYTNWRLPTIEELSTIRYCSEGWKSIIGAEIINNDTYEGISMAQIPVSQEKTTDVPFSCATQSEQPTLDTNIFPNSMINFYWSDTSRVTYTTYAHGVSFTFGGIGSYRKDASNPVRAVRSE